MERLNILPIQLILIAAILIIFVIYIVMLKYVNKYKNKAKLLLENSSDGFLAINPIITKKEAVKNKLVSFKLLYSAKKRNDYSIKVVAKLNTNRSDPFIIISTYHNDELIYIEHLSSSQCHLLVKYFVLAYLK